MADAAPPFTIARLGTAHDRTTFHSGSEPLDRYFLNQATQDIRRRVSACFVAVARDTGAVVGYYTIASSSVPLTDLAPEAARRLPRYPQVPAVRIGRLAVASDRRGQGIGVGLLVDAIARACRAEIVAFAVVVDAKDDDAAAFYRHHKFVALQSQPRTLYLPIAQAAKELGLSPP